MHARQASGFSLLEVLIGVTILSIAMTSYVTGILSHRSLAEEATARSQAVLLADEFMERLRTDDDFASLYSRCRINQELSLAGAGTTMKLGGGRGAFPPSAYYPDSSASGSLAVLIDVPYSLDAAKGEYILREQVSDPDYGLPADLNGDGVVDANARDDDYQALPAVVHFVWRGPGEATREMRLFTWLKGAR